MNIQIATLYAKQGFKIKLPHWNIPIYITKNDNEDVFVYGHDERGNLFHYIFDVNDLLTNDWSLCSSQENHKACLGG